MRALLRFLPRVVRDRLVIRQLQLDADPGDDIVVKIASTLDEHEQAARIVHESYLKRGYIDEQRSGIWVTAHGLMPWTIVFVAKKGDEVVGTMSLVSDSAARLPMDKIYKAELDVLRREGHQLGEVGALCIKSGYRNHGIVHLLNKAMWMTARHVLRTDFLVISVHPSAAPIYEATLLFERLGGERTYPGLKTAAAAVALAMDMVAFEHRTRARFAKLAPKHNIHRYFFVERQAQIQLPSEAELLETLAVRERSANVLGHLRPEAFADLDTTQRRVVRPVFPEFKDELRSLPLLIASEDT